MVSFILSFDFLFQEVLLVFICFLIFDFENFSFDELELLVKFEEQNWFLEVDFKFMCFMNGLWWNSGFLLVFSFLVFFNLSYLEEDIWILWGWIVNEWEEWWCRKEKLFKELICKGILYYFWVIVWQFLCSVMDMLVKNQYFELFKMFLLCEKLICRDIVCIYLEYEFFKGQDSLGQEVFFNVMKVYLLVDWEVGYCQGSVFIVGLFFMQMFEEEVFCVFVWLMQEYWLWEFFKFSMVEFGFCIYQFEYMLQEQFLDFNIYFCF